MKRTLQLCFVSLLMLFAYTGGSIALADTYTHTFASGDLKTTAGTVTLSEVSWTQTAIPYVG